MRKFKIIIKIIIFCFIYIGAQALVKYALVDDTKTISRMMLHELYTEEENIDILFCGASHCQLGIDPMIMDQGFDKNTFNAGSSSQGLETSLALIKEAERYHDLEQVYIDLDYSIVLRDTPNLESIYIISDYMKPSLRKVDYLLNATSFEYYVNSFMPLHKGRGYLKDPGKIWENLKTKSNDGYKKYIDKDPSYAGKGHIASRTVVEEGSLWSSLDVAQKDFSIPEIQKEYLREIIEFCNKNEIQLTFFSVPTTDFHLAFITNYDEYVKEINDFMSEYDIKYYDFNLCNQDVLKLDKDSLYNDDNHLNTVGAKHFSTVFADYFTGRIQREDLFYDSYEMKLKESTPRLLGLQIKMSDSNNTDISVTPITSHSGMQVECDQEYISGEYLITASMDGVVTNKVKVKEEELK